MKFICFHVDHTGNWQWIYGDKLDAYAMVPMFCIAVRNEIPL